MAINNITRFFKKKIYLYKDCSDLSIYNFDKIYKTNDFRYLVLGYDGYKDVEIPINAGERWKNIFDEWVKLCNNNTMMYYYQLILEVAYLETRYKVSKTMLYQIYSRDMNEKTLDLYIEELKHWRYFYNKENDKKSEVKRLFDQRRASKNKLGLKKSELKEMQMEENQEEQTLVGQAVILEQITGKNNIDVKTTSVAKWLEIGRLASKINEHKRRNGK